MKIAYFTDTYKPQINGVVNSIKLSIQKLREKGHEVYIFCPTGTRKNKYTFPVFSKKFESYPEFKISLPSFELIKEVRRINPDIIHVQTPVTVGNAGLAIAKIFDIPVVTTYHTLLKDYIGYVTSDELGDKFIDIYTRCFFNKFSTIIVPTKPIKKILIENGVRKPIIILPTPIEEKMINKSRKRKNKRFTILHVGRLCKEKRVDVVIRAFKNALKSIDAILVITSDGPDKYRLESLAKDLGISKHVNFTGYITAERLKRLYSSSDIFVSASDTETHGLVVLEAMANGCPVIVKNALGFKDVVKNGINGFLFNKENELSEKILLLFKNKKNRDMLICGGLRTARAFNAESYTKKIEEIYRNNLDSEPTSMLDKFFYADIMFFNFIIYYILKKIDFSINSRMINLYLRFIGLFLYFFNLK